MRKLVKQANLTIAGYDISAQDWRGWSAEESLKVLRNSMGRSGVIVLHDAQPNTLKLLPMLLEEIRQRNGTIVHLVVK